MNYFFDYIEVNSVDTEFAPFSFSYGFSIDHLVSSIQQVGLINPPIFKRTKDGFVLVAGYKRMLAVKKLNWSRVGGLMISEDISPLNCLIINLHDNISTRKLNEVEKAILISKLAKYLKPEQIISDYFPLLNLPKHMPVFRLYIWIAESLNTNVKDQLARGDVSLKAVRLMFENEMSYKDIEIYGKLMSKLKFSFNEQIQLIEYSQDICRKEKVQLEQLFEERRIKDIIESKNLTNKDKVKKILAILKEKNFPKLSYSEKVLKERIQKLPLPEGVEFKVPLYFESPYYKLEVFFKDGHELKKKLLKIANVDGLELIRDPWKE